jgi:predicted nuclease with TOPRIM domain
MPDVDARLDTLEQKVTTLGERMDERFQQVDERFQQVDERFGRLETAVQKLRVLAEENTTQIKQVAEVQAHQGSVLHEHSQALKRLEDALEPLKVLPAALQTVLPEYERRITALERKC